MQSKTIAQLIEDRNEAKRMVRNLEHDLSSAALSLPLEVKAAIVSGIVKLSFPITAWAMKTIRDDVADR